MLPRHPSSSARHRHHPVGRSATARGTVERVFLTRDWIHPADDDVPAAPAARGPATLPLFQMPFPSSVGSRRPIAPVPPATLRPTFSVMLPTFDPDLRFVRSLESVLAQAPDVDTMEIVVVDDASPRVDVTALVRSIDPTGRVAVRRHPRRAGLAGNWNRAVDLARGHYIHLLHQDDYVLPGFYAAIERGFRAAPRAGMAFCRSRIVDGDDRLIKTSSRQRWFPGTLSGWLPRIAERQRVQTPAAVVSRSAYERLGGFRDDLCHALDWEMWVRIAADYPVWYEPRALAVYRRHAANESQRLLSSGAVWPDLLQAIELNVLRLPPDAGRRVRARSARWYACSALRTAEKQLARGDIDGAGRTLDHVPGMLRLLPASGDGSPALRRVGKLRERLRTARRRAA